MCLAIPPNIPQSGQYSLPPYWCLYQDLSPEQAAAAAESQCSVSPTTSSRSFLGSVKSGYSGVNHPAGASLVSSKSSSPSSSPLLDLLPATPPPLPQSESYGFDSGLDGYGGQMTMGLSPYIMQGYVNNNDNQRSNNAAAATAYAVAPIDVVSDPSYTASTLINDNIKMMSSQAQGTTTTQRRRRAPQRPGKTATQKERLFVQHNYHDLANESDSPESVPSAAGESFENAAMEAAAKCDAISSSSSLSTSSSSSHPFPIKLHLLLEESEASGLGHIISWQPHGRAFKIHNPTLFTETIMQNYFPKMRKLPSLQRQFNLYGFERLTRDGPDAGAYYHEAFLRYRPRLSLPRMTRKRVKGTGYKAASNPEAEPNLYAYPFMRNVSPSPSIISHSAVVTTEKPARLSASSISSDGTTELSYYSTTDTASRSEGSASQLQQQHHPHQVSSSTSWSNPCMPAPSHNQMTYITSPPNSNGGNNKRTTSASFARDTSFMDRYLNLPQSTQDSMLQDVLTVNDFSSVDSFMEKYLSEEAASLSRQGGRGDYSSSYQQTTSWPYFSGPPSSITMPPLQDQQQRYIRSMGSLGAPSLGNDLSLDSDVDGFMDRYLALPRATQDSILQDLLSLNECSAGSSNSTLLNFENL